MTAVSVFPRLMLVFAAVIFARDGFAMDANASDRAVQHPAIPLLDEAGNHVLHSGKPYSPKTSCGVGAGCHDYEQISHGGHFEMGRDESADDFGTKMAGWSHVTSPGYYGGFNCMGPGILAKKKPGSDGFVGDFGAAGFIKDCNSCHTGGGWSEKDRNGIRYDQKPVGSIAVLDGDYYNRGTDTQNQPADMNTITLWDWKKSGVIENDCLMCHGDYSRLKVFPSSAGALPADFQAYWDMFDVKETPAEPFVAWWSLRNEKLVGGGFFREAASALLEFINLRPDTPEGSQLVSFGRTGDGAGSSLLQLDASGKPVLRWNPNAFDARLKVQIPMRRFPANDNCWQCHGYWLEQDRRGFWGFGEAARPTATGPGGIIETDAKDDVHKGKTFIDNNGEARVIDNCVACHTQGYYYRPPFQNVDLSATHDFPKGYSDIDMRRAIDNKPAPKSCEYCHDNALNKVIPSGQSSMLEAHLQRWTHDGFMTGYLKDTLTRITQTHLDVVACQTCHIRNLKAFDGTPVDIFYRYRKAEDGKLKIAPYVATYQFRYYWRDKNSGRVLTREELFAAYTPKRNEAGDVVAGILKDPVTNATFELAGSWWVPFTPWYSNFKPEEVYAATVALKRNYDNFLRSKGYSTSDVQLVWMESNNYLISHNTRPSPESVPCQDCHATKQDNSFSSLLKEDGLLGTASVKTLTPWGDKRLVDDGLVVLSLPYMKVSADNKIVASIGDILYASKIDPSMTALKAETAKMVIGEWARQDVSSGLAALGITATDDLAAMRVALGTDPVFTFDFPSGDPRFVNMALAAPITSISDALFPRHRLELQFTELTSPQRRAIESVGLGRVVSDRFAFRVTDSLEPIADFSGQPVAVKIPYAGTTADPRRVRLLSGVNGAWVDSGKRPIVVRPGTTPLNGYAVFSVSSPFESAALSQIDEGATAAAPTKARVRSLLTAKNRAAKKASAAAQRARKADAAALRAANKARRLAEKAARLTGEQKSKAEAAAARAQQVAASVAVKAEQARQLADAAIAARESAALAWSSAAQAYAARK